MFTEEFWAKMRTIVKETLDNHKSEIPHQPMTIKELSEYLRCSEQTIYRYTSRRKIPFSKKLGTLYFDKKEIDEWLLSEKPRTAKEIGLIADEYVKNAPRRI